MDASWTEMAAAMPLEASGQARAEDDELTRAHRRYRRRLEAVALRILGNRADAEDAVQRVFLSVHALAGTRPASSWAYLYRAAVNASLSMIRARRGRAALAERLQQARTLEPSREVPAEARILEGQLLTRVAAALCSVKPAHREVLTLRIVWNLSNTEIARRLGIPLATVGTRLRRGRQELRKNLQPLLRDLEARSP